MLFTSAIKENERIKNANILCNKNFLKIKPYQRKVYRRILGPVYDNEKENWRILTNKEFYASVKKPTILEIIRLNRLHWFGHVQRTEENRILKRVLYMNLGTRLRRRPQNRWRDEMREDGRIADGEGRVAGKKYVIERTGRNS